MCIRDSLHTRLDDNNKNFELLKEDLNKKIDNTNRAMDTLNNKIDDSSRALKEELNTALNEISRKMEEGNGKINTRVDAEIAVMREEITEVNQRCEQHGQDLKRTREEVDGRIDNIEEITEARIESLKRMSQDEIKRCLLYTSRCV